jgi:hypothetical protein
MIPTPPAALTAFRRKSLSCDATERSSSSGTPISAAASAIMRSIVSCDGAGMTCAGGAVTASMMTASQHVHHAGGRRVIEHRDRSRQKSQTEYFTYTTKQIRWNVFMSALP